MTVLLLTVFVSLGLVGLALAFFLYQRRSSSWSCLESDSLLPLQEEASRPARSASSSCCQCGKSAASQRHSNASR